MATCERVPSTFSHKPTNMSALASAAALDLLSQLKIADTAELSPIFEDPVEPFDENANALLTQLFDDVSQSLFHEVCSWSCTAGPASFKVIVLYRETSRLKDASKLHD